MKHLITLLLLLAFYLPIQAQPEFDDDVNDAPVDTGTIVISLAGLALGSLRLFPRREE